MNPSDIERIIENLTERLGPSAQHLFDLAVRQVYVEAFLWGTIGFAAFVAGGLLARKAWNKKAESSGYYGSTDAEMMVCLGTLVAAIGFVFFVMAVVPLLNPEWAAIENLGGLWPQ